jgi:4-amino-4-deoxy-L-arabinose transferase-like glycosyltransferase
MANIANQPTLVPISNAFPFTMERTLLWNRIALGAILLASVYMNFFQLGQNGFGNLYYASGVRSMADSWHNFFFVSLDPGGFVTIDKPPIGFWLQTLSVKLFGFTPFSIFLPQAICGLFAVLLLYYLVRRHFGTTAGLIAALALAVSPISVATDRNNTIDGTLALILLLAVWAVMRACETGKFRWLLLGGVFVGLGFNTKMSEAYLIIPALGMAYLLCGPRKIWTCIWHLSVVLVVMLVISLSWAAVVDLTPASQRPYVGSTKDNSEISLAVGYNGLSRLHIGGNTTARPTTDKAKNKTATTETAETAATPDTTTANSQNDAAPPNTSGPLRLFNAFYGSQIAWLLPFALLAILALAWRRRSMTWQAQQLGLVTWGLWLLTMTVFFTLDSSFHQYYLTVMAPGLCALVGIGLVVMWDQYCAPGWRGWLLPIALAITAAAQLSILAYYPAWSQQLRLLIAIPTALVVLALFLFRLLRRQNSAEHSFRSPQYQTSRENSFHAASIIVGIGMFVLLLAPLVWSCYTVAHNPESADPLAGPATQTRFSNFFAANIHHTSQALSKTDSDLISYLQAQQGKTKFLLATPSSATADALILATNRPVMAMGGFSGNDPILTLSSLQASIKNGTIRFFLLNAPRTTRTTQKTTASPKAPIQRTSAASGQNSLTRWVSSHCKALPTKDWQHAKASTGGNVLYDCASLKP